jgi:CMP-N,N'-diacetyllegionaminic acid synthase
MSKPKVLAVIPARGGSKGLPGKNLKRIHGVTLTQLAILVADLCPEVTHIALSSDSDEILREIQDFKGPKYISIKRPPEISNDETPDQPVLVHALEYVQRVVGEISVVAMLQPTSPVRKIEDISICINNVLLRAAESSWTMSKLDPKFHFQKQFEVSQSGSLRIPTERGHVPRRQDLTESYIRNGVCYAYAPETVHNDPLLLGSNCVPRILTYPTVDIDTNEDLLDIEELTTFDGSSVSWKI